MIMTEMFTSFNFNSQYCDAPVFLCVDVSRVKERNSDHRNGGGDGQRCDPSEKSQSIASILSYVTDHFALTSEELL